MLACRCSWWTTTITITTSPKTIIMETSTVTATWSTTTLSTIDNNSNNKSTQSPTSIFIQYLSKQELFTSVQFTSAAEALLPVSEQVRSSGVHERAAAASPPLLIRAGACRQFTKPLSLLQDCYIRETATAPPPQTLNSENVETEEQYWFEKVIFFF